MFWAALSIVAPNWKKNPKYQQENGSTNCGILVHGILHNSQKEQTTNTWNDMNKSLNLSSLKIWQIQKEYLPNGPIYNEVQEQIVQL